MFRFNALRFSNFKANAFVLLFLNFYVRYRVFILVGLKFFNWKSGKALKLSISLLSCYLCLMVYFQKVITICFERFYRSSTLFYLPIICILLTYDFKWNTIVLNFTNYFSATSYGHYKICDSLRI